MFLQFFSDLAFSLELLNRCLKRQDFFVKDFLDWLELLLNRNKGISQRWIDALSNQLTAACVCLNLLIC